MYWLKRLGTGENMKSFRFFSARLVGLFILLGLTLSAVQAQAANTTLKWSSIVGLAQSGDMVGVGTGQVTGAVPWNTTKGSASVNLTSGKVTFSVTGLILAVGSAPGDSLFGEGIGTSGGVTGVEGTLVCNVDGLTGGTGNSVTMDTASVPLSFEGNASFKGSFGSIDPSCTAAPQDTAFLIRITEPVGFLGLYIAFGGVLTVH